MARDRQRRDDQAPRHPDRSRRAAEPQSAHLKRDRRGLPDRWHWSGTPSPAPRRHTRQRHPRPLCGSAPLREKINAAMTSARSTRRSPRHPDRSRRAAEPQSAHLKRDRRGLPDRWHWSGTPSPAPRRHTRQRHPRPLCGSAPLREKINAAMTSARSTRRSPRHPDRSRRAAEPQSAHLKRDRRGLPDRWHWSGTPSPAPRRHTRQRHPRPLCGSAPLREKNNAAMTSARSTRRSPRHPDRSRRAAEPQSAHLKRDRRGLPDRPPRSGAAQASSLTR
jgi:hypothetical protein